MQFVQAPCYATMGKLSDINDIFNRRKNVFHLSEFSAKSENPIPFYRIVSRNFHLTASTSIDNMNRVVAVSAFYETKQTADEQVSFAKNDQKVNR